MNESTGPAGVPRDPGKRALIHALADLDYTERREVGRLADELAERNTEEVTTLEELLAPIGAWSGGSDAV